MVDRSHSVSGRKRLPFRKLFGPLDLDAAAIIDIEVELQLEHEGAQINVAARHRTDPRVLKRVGMVIVQAWRPVKFANSRWLSPSASYHAVLGSLFLGCYR